MHAHAIRSSDSDRSAPDPPLTPRKHVVWFMRRRKRRRLLCSSETSSRNANKARGVNQIFFLALDLRF